MEHFELPAPNNCSQNVIVIVAVGNSCIWSVKQIMERKLPTLYMNKKVEQISLGPV